MNKILIAFQGILSRETLNSALSFNNLFLGNNYKINIIFIAWKDNNKKFIKPNGINLIYLDDPLSIQTIDKKYYINLNRQITSSKYIIDNYQKEYDYIIKIRSDIKLINPSKFRRELLHAFKKPKMWILNIPTSSPRILTPISLKNHFSDWFYGGTPQRIKEFLHLSEIDECILIENTPYNHRDNVFWRKAQNEQLIWEKAWADNKNSLNKEYKLFGNQWQKRSISNSYRSANYLHENFYISPFIKSGLSSTKHIQGIISWYKNNYSILNLNFIETFLINKGFTIISIFYLPILRFIFYKLSNLLKGKKGLRF